MSKWDSLIPLRRLKHIREHDQADIEAGSDSDLDRPEKQTEKTLRLLAENFQLPAVVKTDVNSWINVANTLAITTALFAAVQISLAQIVEQSPKANDGTLWRTLNWLAYSTVLVNISGTAAAISVVNMASSLSNQARDLILRKADSCPRRIVDGKPLPKHLLRPHNTHLRLEAFGMPPVFFWLTRFMVVSFILGSAMIFTTFSLWVWATQSKLAASLLMPILLPACWLTFSVVHY